MKSFVLWAGLLLSGSCLYAQTPAAPAFTASVTYSSDSTGFIIIKAGLPDSMMVFSAASPGADNPFRSSIEWDTAASKGWSVTGPIQETGGPANSVSGQQDSNRTFKDSVVIMIPVRWKPGTVTAIKGTLSWLGKLGDNYPAGAFAFEVPITAASGQSASQQENGATASLKTIFLQGFLAGLGAFIMPCIYAMVPVTVSFFTKRSKTRKQGLKNAGLYAASIVGIFTAIGFLITLFFGKGALNEMASSAWFNVGVFVLFLLFGISFLGAFEINLPSGWSNKIDSKSGLHSYSGIFFLALTLVIVSFSCTVPFIGALTVLIARGSYWAPLTGFFAFSLALALPFALFTVFPGLLQRMAKSGDWLNTLKVSLGFIELALALKFLSSADLAYHWGLLDREVYLSLWIVIFGLLGWYLLGKLKFHHDNALPANEYGQPYLSVPRLFFAIAALSFTVYMIPGLWGAPLNGISAWLPEMKTQDFRQATNAANTGSTSSASLPAPVKYTAFLESEIPGVNSYFDYEEALLAAKASNKPLMIDFTGHSCANCRKMEREVLNDEKVKSRLQNDFVVVSLYVDDKYLLPETEWVKSSTDETILKKLGEKNLDFQVKLTNNNAQPYYVFTDTEGKLLDPGGYGYDPDIEQFVQHLDRMKALFSKKSAEK